MSVLIIIAVVYFAFHLGHSHANLRHGRRAGRHGLNLYWSSAMGPYASMRIPGTSFRLGHRL